MNMKVYGGTTNYGQLVGILMIDSTIPRVPGDPGHAETFPFPVRYGMIRGFPFKDLVDIKKDNLDLVIKAAVELEKEGVSFRVSKQFKADFEPLVASFREPRC